MTDAADATGDAMLDRLRGWADAPLDDELAAWVDQHPTMGLILKHPLVYQWPLLIPGQANEQLVQKKESLAEAIADKNWSQVIWLHERPYRLDALLVHVLDLADNIPAARSLDPADVPALGDLDPAVRAVALRVWVDAENIPENIEFWRALFNDGDVPFLTDDDDGLDVFDALPDPVPAYRGGTAGDWSWATDRSTAEIFSHRSGYPVREALIPKADVFGYLTARGETELLVCMTAEREPLVHPERYARGRRR